MIGLSLSLCIKDILEGEVKVENVEQLIISVMAPIESSEWKNVIEDYKRSYWRRFDDNEIDKLIESLKPLIVIPRLDCSNKYPIVLDGHWVSSEEEIRWN